MYFWAHSESESIGTVDTKDELHQMMETPLVYEITENEFNELKAAGWDV